MKAIKNRKKERKSKTKDINILQVFTHIKHLIKHSYYLY